jgi:hypothetical protein
MCIFRMHAVAGNATCRSLSQIGEPCQSRLRILSGTWLKLPVTGLFIISFEAYCSLETPVLGDEKEMASEERL